MRKFIVMAMALILGGCAGTSLQAPSPLRAIRMASDITDLGTFSDAGIVLYASETLDSYEGSDTTNTILALSGAGSIGALGTAAVAAPGIAKGVLLGANGILMALNLWRPVERASADTQGAGLIREALGAYVEAVIADGYCTIPHNRVTPSGAVLFANVNAAITVVANLRQGILDLGSRSVQQLQAARAESPIRARAALPEGCRK